MNLASRCRSSISEAARLKKELNAQKKRTAEAVAQTHQLLDQLKKMHKKSDGVNSQATSPTASDSSSPTLSDRSAKDSPPPTAVSTTTTTTTKERNSSESPPLSVRKLVTKTPAAHDVVYHDESEHKSDDPVPVISLNSANYPHAATATKLISSDDYENDSSSLEKQSNNNDLSTSTTSSSFLETTEEGDDSDEQEKKDTIGNLDVPVKSLGGTKKEFFPQSASPKVPRKNQNREYDEEYPADICHESNSATSLMNSIDLFEASFNTALFPDSFSPGSESKDAYDPFGETTKDTKHEQPGAIFEDFQPKPQPSNPTIKAKELLETLKQPKKTDIARVNAAEVFDRVAKTGDEKKQQPKSEASLTPSKSETEALSDTLSKLEAKALFAVPSKSETKATRDSKTKPAEVQAKPDLTTKLEETRAKLEEVKAKLDSKSKLDKTKTTPDSKTKLAQTKATLEPKSKSDRKLHAPSTRGRDAPASSEIEQTSRANATPETKLKKWKPDTGSSAEKPTKSMDKRAEGKPRPASASRVAEVKAAVFESNASPPRKESTKPTGRKPLTIGADTSQVKAIPVESSGREEKFDRFISPTAPRETTTSAATPSLQPEIVQPTRPQKVASIKARERYEKALGKHRTNGEEKTSPTSPSIRDRVARFSSTNWKPSSMTFEDSGDIPMQSKLSPPSKRKPSEMNLPNLDMDPKPTWRETIDQPRRDYAERSWDRVEEKSRPRAVMLDDDDDTGTSRQFRGRRNVNLSSSYQRRGIRDKNYANL